MSDQTGDGIGQYLIERLKASGVGHVFGVPGPGDFVLRFFDLLAHSGMGLVNTADEQGAGFAADIYARMRGLGVVCVTFGVGGLKLANSIAQAFAERSPVVVISGAPGVAERKAHPLLHHKSRDFDTQQRIFEPLTVAEAVARLAAATQPVILAGVDLQRFGLQDRLLRLARTAGISVADTLMSKSVIGEREAAYLGLYQGGMSHPAVRDYVESSDCVLLLGVLMSDTNLGIFTARLEPARCISADSDRLAVGYRRYENVCLERLDTSAPLRRLTAEPAKLQGR